MYNNSACICFVAVSFISVIFVCIKEKLNCVNNKSFLFLSKDVDLPGVPKKYRRLSKNRTKAFCLIFRLSLLLDKAYPNLDFDIKIVKIC